MILDAFAGHGTFIAGLIANLAPGAKITVAAGLSTFGDTDDAAIAEALLARFPEGGGDDPPFDIVSMSFGGFCESDDPPIAMSKAIASIQRRYRTVDADDPTHHPRAGDVRGVGGQRRIVPADMAGVVRERDRGRCARP